MSSAHALVRLSYLVQSETSCCVHREVCIFLSLKNEKTAKIGEITRFEKSSSQHAEYFCSCVGPSLPVKSMKKQKNGDTRDINCVEDNRCVQTPKQGKSPCISVSSSKNEPKGMDNSTLEEMVNVHFGERDV